jgi:mono/diheme cytochrome c family protein
LPSASDLVRAVLGAALLIGSSCSSVPASPGGDAGPAVDMAVGAPGAASTSSSIVLSADESVVWVASPDDDAVVEVGTGDLMERRRVAVAGGPLQMTRVSGASGAELLAVTLGQAAELAMLSLVDGHLAPAGVRRIALPCGGTRAVVQSGHDTLLVSCPNDARVVEVNLAQGAVSRTLELAGEPYALALDGGDGFAVTLTRAGLTEVYSALSLQRMSSTALVGEHGFSASQVHALAVDPRSGDFTTLYQRVDRDSDRTRPPEEGGYGQVVDGQPRIEPRLSGACGGRYARYDGGARVFSGASAIAFAHESGLMFVAHRYTDNLAVLDCAAAATAGAGESDLLPLRASVRVGRGPAGLAVSADGLTAYVDVGFDHAVARVTVPSAAPATEAATDADQVQRRDVGTTALSDAALRGRSLFHDAVNIHLTPSGVVTCATCHPSGATDDGLVWFIHTVNIPAKVRRTQSAWGGRPMLAPFHWDGMLHDVAMLSEVNILQLMEGDGLLVDTSDIAAYLAEVPLPPPRPVTSAEQSTIDRGQAVFSSAGCAACHPAPLYADGMSHAVVAPSTDADAALTQVDTPTLLRVRARPPYLSDGRAPTLKSLFTDHNPDDQHGHTAGLPDADLDALVLFLETL